MAARLPDPLSEHAVANGMFRALAWLRVVVTLNLLGLTWWRQDNFEHVGWGMAVIAGLVVWTVFTCWAYAAPQRRQAPLLVADLTVAAVALLLTPVIKGDTFNATLPGFWVAPVVLAWGVRWRWGGGLAAAGVIVVCDLAIRLPHITETNYANLFLLLVAGPLLGYLAGVLRRLAVEREAAQRAAALAEERARLGRAVHDGVLQVLALMQRKGPEIGGEAAELGRLAGEQEARLRALLQTGERGDAKPVGDRSAGERSALDLATALAELATRTSPIVEVSTPGSPVPLAAETAEELLAAVSACLDNVARHVGERATAWVFLEDLGAQVAVSVRDEGPGIPDGRLESAAEQGRLGVRESICGRLRDLGGEAHLTTGPQGTEWELVVPRRTS